MASGNDEFQDALLRRQITLLRFSEGLADRVIERLDTSEAELVRLIRLRLDEIGEGGKTATASQVEQLQGLLFEVREVRREIFIEAAALARGELTGLNILEVSATQQAYTEALGFKEAILDAPTLARLRAVTFGSPFAAGPTSPVRTFSQWMTGLGTGDVRRVEGAIQAGFLEGDTIDGIVRRVRGTKALDFADGVTQITRRQARTVVRTTVNAYANAVREEIFEVNDDVIPALKWASVLDGRTTPICQSRDGKLAPVAGKELPKSTPPIQRLQPPGARPPAHPNCRSVMVAVIDPENAVGKRPFITDTRTRREREIDFRKEARERGVPIQQIRAEWARERVGNIPAETTYQQWLERQSAGFQDDVLGPTRGKLFRLGGLTLDRFVDTTGKRFTLEQLQELHPAAFKRVGVEV